MFWGFPKGQSENVFVFAHGVKSQKVKMMRIASSVLRTSEAFSL